MLVVLAVRRRTLLAPLQGPREQVFAAGLVGAFFATVVSALANDSGPLILIVGAAALLLAAGYVQGVPRTAERRLLG